MVSSKLHVACVQLCSTEHTDDNLNTIESILAPYQKDKLDFILLPENAVLLTSDNKLKHQAAQPESCISIFKRLSKLAQKHRAWLVAGSLLIQNKHQTNKYFNHCPVFSPDGKLVTHYNKIHLFDANLHTESWHESKHISAGKRPKTFSLDDDWKVGLSICYDLRFPELYRYYSSKGCNIMSIPAAFTVPTGQAHWETLLKARAIENQSYVLAAGQWGKHDDGRETYGHSMIIDPWGKVLAKLPQGEGVVMATLSLEHLQEIRTQMPALQHRKLM